MSFQERVVVITLSFNSPHFRTNVWTVVIYSIMVKYIYDYLERNTDSNMTIIVENIKIKFTSLFSLCKANVFCNNSGISPPKDE